MFVMVAGTPSWSSVRAAARALPSLRRSARRSDELAITSAAARTRPMRLRSATWAASTRARAVLVSVMGRLLVLQGGDAGEGAHPADAVGLEDVQVRPRSPVDLAGQALHELGEAAVGRGFDTGLDDLGLGQADDRDREPVAPGGVE